MIKLRAVFSVLSGLLVRRVARVSIARKRIGREVIEKERVLKNGFSLVMARNVALTGLF